MLVLADDLGYGDVGYLGNAEIRTPTLDAMAASAVRFDRFYAAASVCSPTRASVLTGRNPVRCGVFSWGWSLRPEEVTLAEIVKPAGHATGHFGKWHLGGVGAGAATSPGGQGFDTWVSSPNFFENDPPLSRAGKVVYTKGEGSEVTVDFALEFITGAVRQQRPFFAVVWFGSPHTPHEALAADREPYKHLPERMQHYYGEITALDRAVGKLRSRLRELRVADDTLLWFTSDNGATTPGSSGPLKGKKGTLWEGGVRVPSLLEWPARFPEPQRISEPCTTSDILPTILAATGVDYPVANRPLDGEDVLPLFDPAEESKATAKRKRPIGLWTYPVGGKPTKSGALLAELERATSARPAGDAPLLSADEVASFAKRYPSDQFPGHAAWIDGRYKLHRILIDGSAPKYHLFDLTTDPEESADLARSHSGKVESMSEALAAWQKSVLNSLNGGDY